MRISEIEQHQVPEGMDVLLSSFIDDPGFQRLFPDQSIRAKILPGFFKACLLDGLSNGKVLGAWDQEELIGVAVWFPPESIPMSVGRKLKMAYRFIPTFIKWPSLTIKMMNYTDKLFEQQPSGPFWYLEALGVKEGSQGKGIGTQLVQTVTQLADLQRHACYLETMNERNIKLYTKLGFNLTKGGLELIPAGPTAFLMFRPPSAQ